MNASQHRGRSSMLCRLAEGLGAAAPATEKPIAWLHMVGCELYAELPHKRARLQTRLAPEAQGAILHFVGHLLNERLPRKAEAPQSRPSMMPEAASAHAFYQRHVSECCCTGCCCTGRGQAAATGGCSTARWSARRGASA